MTNIYLRRSTINDLDEIIEIIDQAKQLLKNDGSPQWQSGDPSREILKSDIEQRISWVLLVDDKVAGVATLLDQPEPSYAQISAGNWNNTTQPYMTIHRVAVSADYRGQHLSKFLFSNLMTIAMELGFHNLRIDTHLKNQRMQRIAKNLGFEYRGIVNVSDPIDPSRLAYELNL